MLKAFALVALLLVLPQLAGAQVAQPFTSRSGSRWGGNRPVMPEPTGVLAHVWFDGATIRDTVANSWTVNGTVPKLAPHRSPMAPSRGMAGNFLTANADWTLGSGADSFDLANFETCAWFIPAANGTAYWVLGNGSVGAAGYHLGVTAAGLGTLSVVAATVTTTNAVVVGSLNTLCGGRSSTTGYVSLNGGPTATGVVTAGVDAARAVNLGGGNSKTTPLNGYLLELVFSSTAYTDAWPQGVAAVASTLQTK